MTFSSTCARSRHAMPWLEAVPTGGAPSASQRFKIKPSCRSRFCSRMASFNAQPSSQIRIALPTRVYVHVYVYFCVQRLGVSTSTSTCTSTSASTFTSTSTLTHAQAHMEDAIQALYRLYAGSRRPQGLYETSFQPLYGFYTGSIQFLDSS